MEPVTVHINQPSGAQSRLEKGREWIWKTNRNALHFIMLNIILAYKGCVFLNATWLTQGYSDYMHFPLHIKNITYPALDETPWNFTSCSPEIGIMPFLPISQMKNRLRKVDCFSQWLGKNSDACLSNSRNLEWLFRLPNQKVTTEIG